jgi:hypothetical protein
MTHTIAKIRRTIFASPIMSNSARVWARRSADFVGCCVGTEVGVGVGVGANVGSGVLVGGDVVEGEVKVKLYKGGVGVGPKSIFCMEGAEGFDSLKNET